MKQRGGRPWPRTLSLASSLAALTFLAGAGPAAATISSQAPTALTQAAAVSVEQAVRNALAAGETPAVLVKFRGKADLSAAFGMTDRNARATYVYQTLRDFAATRQASVVQTLASQYRLSEAAHEYTVLWIDNAIAISRLSAPMLSSLEADPAVESVRVQKEIPLPQEPATETPPWQLNDAVSSLAHIKVPEVWALGHKGAGVVVANIDAGVRYTHQALVGKYRGNLGSGSFDHNYNWYDPYNHSAAPRYSDPHGSHTMGTMVGDGGTTTTQTGAAPDAKWVACIGFGLSGAGATDAGLLECGQWALAPYPTAGGGTPDPTKHPDIVNNSWGDCGRSYDDWYEGVIDGWIAAGIVPVFSNGNASNCGYPSNPPLNTVGNPARSGKVLGIGSTGTTNGLYASHSNKGTTDNPNPGLPNYPDSAGFPNLKPNVVAPGVSIRSSGSSSDTTYYNETGTSMSAPAAAGVIALMWSAAECLRGDYATTGTLLMNTANPVPVATGSPSDGPGNVPNQATGWGEIDALAAVNASIQHCATSAVPSVTKEFAPALIANGASSTLTIHLANPAATEATLTAALTDTFPANLVVASTPAASTTCTSGSVTAAAGAGSVSLGSGAKIPAGGACTVTVSVTSTVNGSYDNVIAAGALQTDAGNSAAEATATLAVNASGQNPPTLAKAFAPTTIPEGGTSTLTITLSNDNASAVTLSGDLVDSFPSGLVVASAPNASSTCGGAVTAAAGSGSVTLAGSGSSIPGAGSCTVKVDVSSATAGSYANTIPAGALQTGAGSNAAAASAALTVTSAAGVVCSNPINHTIATDLDGSYFGWVSGQVSDDTFSGWNFNPYGLSGSFAFFWNSSGGDAGVAATASQRDWLVLQTGAVVGPSSTFSSATGVATNWIAGVDGYLGFKFNCAAGTCYGYAHMTTTGATGFPATLVDYCYDSSGSAITISGGTPLNDPSAAVTPASLSFTVAANATATEQVNIANAAGSSALTYSIEARDASKAVLFPHTSRIDRTRLSKAGTSNPGRDAKLAQLQARTPSGLTLGGRRGGNAAPWSPQGSIQFQLDDGTYEDNIGWGDSQSNPTTENSAVWVNRYTATGALTVDSVSIMWPQDNAGTLVGKQVNIVAYYDADGDGDPTNAVRLGTDKLQTIASLDAFLTYTTNFSVPGAGDVYIGFFNTYANGTSTPLLHPAAIDQGSALGDSWLGASGSGDGDVNFAANEVVGTIGDLSGGQLDGNWMIRATGTGGGSGGACTGPVVNWLTATPSAGSVNGGANVNVTVKADPAAGSLAAGSYTGELCITTNDPTQALIAIPVSLTVTAAPVEACSSSDQIFCDGFDGQETGDPNVVTGDIDQPVTGDGDGSSFDFALGDFHPYSGSITSDDINLYTLGLPAIAVYWYGDAVPAEFADLVGGVVATPGGTDFRVLQSGDTIGPDSPVSAASQGADMSAFDAGVDGYIGVAFYNEGTGAVNYGYLHVTTSAGGFPVQALDYGYNSVGEAITIP
jgi:hypothetical protein